MAFIEKELLIGRVQYLEKINSKPGFPAVNKEIINKVIELITEDKLLTFMQVEAVFNYLLETTIAHQRKLRNQQLISLSLSVSLTDN
jgi:hypothetical protein